MSLLLCYSFMPQDNSPVFTGFAGKKTCCFVRLTEIHKKEGVYRGNSSQRVDSIHLFRLTWANSILSSSDFITAEEKHLSFFLMAYEWKRQSTVSLNKKEKMRRLSWTECRNTTYRLHTPFTLPEERVGQHWACCLFMLSQGLHCSRLQKCIFVSCFPKEFTAQKDKANREKCQSWFLSVLKGARAWSWLLCSQETAGPAVATTRSRISNGSEHFSTQHCCLNRLHTVASMGHISSTQWEKDLQTREF